MDDSGQDLRTERPRLRLVLGGESLGSGGEGEARHGPVHFDLRRDERVDRGADLRRLPAAVGDGVEVGGGVALPDRLGEGAGGLPGAGEGAAQEANRVHDVSGEDGVGRTGGRILPPAVNRLQEGRTPVSISQGETEIMSTSDPVRPLAISERHARLVALSDTFPTQKAFSEAIGLGESRVSKALSGDTITERKLLPIEHAVSERNLWSRLSERGSRQSPPPKVSADTLSSDEEETGSEEVIDAFVEVPQYGHVGAGDARIPPKQIGKLRVSTVEYAHDFGEPPRVIGDRYAPSGHFGYFIIDGDSAVPVFFDRERVPVQMLPPERTFANDLLYVFRLHGEYQIKRLRLLSKKAGLIRATSLNPSIDPFEFTVDDGEDFAVVALARMGHKQQLYTALVGRFLRIDP